MGTAFDVVAVRTHEKTLPFLASSDRLRGWGLEEKGAVFMEMTRRDMVKLGLVGSAGLALPLERVARTAFGDRLRDLPPMFRAHLPMPKVLRPSQRTPTTDFYEMTMREADVDILPGLKTRIFGYNGLFPGPTLKCRAGRKVAVRYVNRLPVPTSVHTHGAYVDGDSDGHPVDMTQPGGAKTYFFGNDENARTQWYHDHALHITAQNVYRGLAGFYLIEDDHEDKLPLPKGEFDIPLVIMDRLFNADGSLHYPFDEADHSTNGVEGDVILVNGKPWPRLEVARRKYRFRILNGSNARDYRLALTGGRPLTLIATEGGLINRPVSMRSLPISPAERYEVVIDFKNYKVGDQVVLRNLLGKGPLSQIMRFDVVRNEVEEFAVPLVCRSARAQIDATHPQCSPDQATVRRRFEFKRRGGFWTINGKIFDEHRIDARPRRGAVELWEFVNNGGGWIHPVHLHLVNFKIIERNGRRPARFEAGWKETAFLGPNDRVTVLTKFPKVPRGPHRGDFFSTYAFHCHVVEHEDHDMMMQFKVMGA